ncbi:MAG: retropepsin-like aspartic protease, partial [Crocinitomicaceae bacterium]|nr:retropepsin-like aspartic protease [Crocinitomicaceae bacterium]
MSKFNQLILKAGIMIATILLASIPYTVLSQTSVKMQKEDGVFYVPCSVNGLPLRFIFDTGAGDVSISLSEAIFMLKNGYLKDADLFGTEQYQIANGDIAEGTKINIRELKIGDRVLYNVEASIVHSLSAPILLGQSALGRFGSFSIDNNSNTLILNGSSSSSSTSTSTSSN